MVIFRLYIKKTLQHLTERCNQPKPNNQIKEQIKIKIHLNDEGELSPQTSDLTLLD